MGGTVETRTCARCGNERSVAGVWYLLDADQGRFVCEPCYREQGGDLTPSVDDRLQARP